MKKIDYSKLSTGMLIGTTSYVRPFSYLTRFTLGMGQYRRLAKASLSMFDFSMPTHTMVVYRSGGLFYAMEMTAPKIHIRDLNEFETVNPFKERIVWAGMLPELANKEKDIVTFLEFSHEKSIKYGYGSLLEFWGIKEFDKADKWICSALPREMMKSVHVGYPKEFDEKVSPLDWKNWKAMETVDIWRKK